MQYNLRHHEAVWTDDVIEWSHGQVHAPATTVERQSAHGVFGLSEVYAGDGAARRLRRDFCLCFSEGE